MRNQSYHQEAEVCRRSAELFAGKPEASFLLQVAGFFEELAERQGERDAPAPNSEGTNLSSGAAA